MRNPRLLLSSLILFLLLSACTLKAFDTAGGENLVFSPPNTDLTFKSGDLSLKINPTGTPSDIFIQIKSVSSTLDVSSIEHLDYASDLYQIKNLPSTFQGSIEIRLPLPQSVLANLAASPDRYEVAAFLAPLSDDRPGSASVSMPVTVDAKTKEAVVQLDSVMPGAGIGFNRLSAKNQKGTYQLDGFTIQIHAVWGHYQYAESDHFKLRFLDYKDSSLGILVLAEFERVFADLQKLRLNLGKYETGSKLQVYLQYQEDDGSFQCTDIFHCPFATINSAPFPSNQVITDLPVETIASIAHETFHLVHFIDHANYTLEFDWLDEASATWYETYYLKSRLGLNGYVSENAVKHTNFFQYSQFFPPQADARDVGYGASVFIQSLVDKFGIDLIRNYFIYEKTDQSAVLYSLDTLGASISIEWREFLEKMISDPASYYPATDRVDQILSSTVAYITADTNSGGTDLNLETTKSIFAVQTLPGHIGLDGAVTQPLEINIQKKMYEIHSNALLLRFSTTQPFNGTGKLTLNFEGPEFSGLMVFGIEPGTAHSYGGTVLAGASSFLSTDNLGGGTSLVIEGFGTQEQSKFDRILLVPFNALGTNAGDTVSPITIHALFEVQPPPTELVSDSMEIEQLLDNSACNMNPEGAYCCSGCIDLCPSVSSSPGETGGMGEGNDSSECPPCLQIPDWCWRCKSDVTDFFYEFDPKVLKLTLHLDSNRALAGITDLSGPQMLYAGGLTPKISFNPVDGSFSATFRGLSGQAPQDKAYLIYKGVVKGTTASGTWTLGYDGVGEIATANWTASTVASD